MQSPFWSFQTITVSQCCLIKLLPYILFEKIYIYILALEMASPREPALCHAMDVMLAHNGQYLVLEIESCARTNSQKGRILLLAGSIGLLHLSYIAALQ